MSQLDDLLLTGVAQLFDLIEKFPDNLVLLIRRLLLVLGLLEPHLVVPDQLGLQHPCLVFDRERHMCSIELQLIELEEGVDEARVAVQSPRALGHEHLAKLLLKLVVVLDCLLLAGAWVFNFLRRVYQAQELLGPLGLVLKFMHLFPLVVLIFNGFRHHLGHAFVGSA